MRKTHDYVHYYRGYWSEGGKCRIRIYREEGREPVVVCSQLADNANTSVTNMAEYIAAEVIEETACPRRWSGSSTTRSTRRSWGSGRWFGPRPGRSRRFALEGHGAPG